MVDLARVEDGKIIIEVFVDHLPIILEGGYLGGYYDKFYKIINKDVFAHELVNMLNTEDEGGESLVTRMFDKAIEDVIDFSEEVFEEPT